MGILGKSDSEDRRNVWSEPNIENDVLENIGWQQESKMSLINIALQVLINLGSFAMHQRTLCIELQKNTLG